MSKKTLRETAMLARLTVRGWSAQKLDAQVSNKTCRDNKAKEGMARTYKVLVKSPALNGYWNTTQAARAFQYQLTLPWLDNALRILPVKRYDEYREGLTKYIEEAQGWAAKFIADYDTRRAEDRENLGDMFRDEDYPSTQAMRRKFAVESHIYPIPDGEDWRVDVGAAEVAKIKAQIQEDVTNAVQGGVTDLWNRLYKRAEHMYERLNDPNKALRSTLVTGTEDLLALLDDLNVGDDPKLTNAVATLRLKVTSKGTEKLKEEKTRGQAAKDVKAVLDDIQQYIA